MEWFSICVWYGLRRHPHGIHPFYHRQIDSGDQTLSLQVETRRSKIVDSEQPYRLQRHVDGGRSLQHIVQVEVLRGEEKCTQTDVEQRKLHSTIIGPLMGPDDYAMIFNYKDPSRPAQLTDVKRWVSMIEDTASLFADVYTIPDQLRWKRCKQYIPIGIYHCMYNVNEDMNNKFSQIAEATYPTKLIRLVCMKSHKMISNRQSLLAGR